MIIDCIADLHGYYPKLDGGDLLIVAGDLTARDNPDSYFQHLADWIDTEPSKYDTTVIVAGNHDNMLQRYGGNELLRNCTYLCDSGTEFEGLKIWGSPWTLTFPGINPHCTAFTGSETDLEAKFKLIPDDTDILVTHGPPYGIMDEVHREVFCGEMDENVGSKKLAETVKRIERPGIKHKFHIFGHIHEGYGTKTSFATTFINCSHVNELYKPVNKPIRVEFCI